MSQNFFAPGFDETTEQQNIARNRQYAELMRQQGQQSIGPGKMVGRTYVAPSFTEGLASLLKSYQGGQGVREADDRQMALANAVRGRQTEEMGKFANLMGGTPAREIQPLTPNDDDGNVNPVANQAAVPGDMKAAYQYAMGAQTPGLQQAGMQGMMQMPQLAAQQQERTDNRLFRKEEAEATRAQRMQELEMRISDGRASQAERLAAQKEMREMQIQGQKDMRQLAASMRPAPAEKNAQIIQTADGPMQMVNGQAMPIMGANGQAVKAANSEKPLTEFQGKSSTYGTRAQQAHDQLNDLEGKYDPAMVKLNQAGGMTTNWAMSPQVQKANQAQRNFVNGVLRQESGAAIAKDEFANASQQYFPQPGDTQDVIAQKKANRETAIAGFERSAGPGGADVKAMREQNAATRAAKAVTPAQQPAAAKRIKYDTSGNPIP